MKSKLALLKCHVLLNQRMLENKCIQAIMHFQDRHAQIPPGRCESSMLEGASR